MPLPDFAIPGVGAKAPGPGAGMPINPVQEIQKKYLMQSEIENLRKASAMYGLHAPLRLQMEREILAEHRRLPGLTSNLVGLSESMGISDDIEPEDMYYQADDCPTVRTGTMDLHSMMEARLGMNVDQNQVTNLNLTEDAYKVLSHAARI
jgi:proteasome maturation protein